MVAWYARTSQQICEVFFYIYRNANENWTAEDAAAQLRQSELTDEIEYNMVLAYLFRAKPGVQLLAYQGGPAMLSPRYGARWSSTATAEAAALEQHLNGVWLGPGAWEKV